MLWSSKSALVLYATLFTNLFANSFSSKNWTHQLELDPFGKVQVKWKIETGWIYFELNAPTKGYVALGLSKQPNSMAESDIYVAWLDVNGVGHVKDFHCPENGAPLEDRKQDALLLSAAESEGQIWVMFRRRLDTCDPQDIPINDDTIFLIWAISNEDPSEFKGLSRLHYHGKDIWSHGSKPTFLMSFSNMKKLPDELLEYPEDKNHFDLTLANIKVPELETYFHCKLFKLPRRAWGKNLLGYRPIVSEENKKFIHGLSLFRCELPPVSKSVVSLWEKYLDHPGADCYTDEAPLRWAKYCTELEITFGRGTEGLLFPDHLTTQIPSSSSEQFFYRLEIHYENPRGEYGVDSAGIRIFYKESPGSEESLQQHEAGILLSGARRSPFMAIPPYQLAFSVYGYCAAECTRNGFRTEGIRVVAVLLKTHRLARKVVLRHIRGGQELTPIVQDNNIQYEYQNYRMLPAEVRVLPGDQLITECIYDTSENTTFVFGGLSAQREECSSFMLYYPKSILTSCQSQPELYQFLGAVGVMNVSGKPLQELNLPYNPANLRGQFRNRPLPEDNIVLEKGKVDQLSYDPFRELIITQPQALKNQDVGSHLSKLEWQDDFFSKLVEQKWRVGPHYFHCSAVGGRKVFTNKHITALRYKDFVRVDDSSVSSCMVLDNFISSSQNSQPPGISSQPIYFAILSNLFHLVVQYTVYFYM